MSLPIETIAVIVLSSLIVVGGIVAAGSTKADEISTKADEIKGNISLEKVTGAKTTFNIDRLSKGYGKKIRRQQNKSKKSKKK